MANALPFNDLRRKPVKVDAFVPRGLQPSIGKSASSTVTLQFSAEAARRLEQLAARYANGSNSDVVRKALYLYDWCRTVENSGACLLLKSSDGDIRHVRFP
jgi:hypothetical protein